MIQCAARNSLTLKMREFKLILGWGSLNPIREGVNKKKIDLPPPLNPFRGHKMIIFSLFYKYRKMVFQGIFYILSEKNPLS